MFSCERRAFARAFRALGLCSTWPRKHRPCHALATWTPGNTAPAMLWPLGRSKGRPLGLENTAPAVLWPLGRPKTPHLPCFGHSGARRGCSRPRSVPQGRSNGPLEPPLGAPKTLEGAAPPPARCPQGTRRGCSSPRSVPRWRSQGLLKPARCLRRLQVGAQASAQYPPCVQSAISTTCSVLQRGTRATSCVT